MGSETVAEEFFLTFYPKIRILFYRYSLIFLGVVLFPLKQDFFTPYKSDMEIRGVEQNPFLE